MTVDDKYVSATHAGNLRVEADKSGHADVIIAVGWCKKRLYGALTRLKGEWDGAGRVPPAAKESAHEFALLLGRLKTLPEVRGELTQQAWRMGIEAPDVIAAAVLLWWLDPVCGTCHGVQREKVSHQTVCPTCHGSGRKKLPHGEAGKDLIQFIESTIGDAQGNIKRSLRRS